MRKFDLNRLRDPENKAVNYEVPRTKINNFSLFSLFPGSLFCLCCPEWAEMMDLGCVNIMRDLCLHKRAV